MPVNDTVVRIGREVCSLVGGEDKLLRIFKQFWKIKEKN